MINSELFKLRTNVSKFFITVIMISFVIALGMVFLGIVTAADLKYDGKKASQGVQASNFER